MMSKFGIWKLISGIINVCLCAFVGFQSCAAGIGNVLSENGEVSGSSGILVTLMPSACHRSY